MDQKSNDIDKLFKTKMDGFEVPLSDELTSKLDSEIKQLNKMSRKKKVRNLLFSILGLSILGTLSWVFLFSNKNGSDKYNTSTSADDSTYIQEDSPTTLHNTPDFDTLDNWENTEYIIYSEEQNNTATNSSYKKSDTSSILNSAKNNTSEKEDKQSNKDVAKDKPEVIQQTTNRRSGYKKDYEDYESSIRKPVLNRTYSNTPEGVANKNIDYLQKGVLLVRLKTKKKTIEAYRKAGYEDEAREVAKNVRSENLNIARGFKENFNFCPVYFFYSTNSDSIRKSTYKGVILDYNLRPVKNVDFNQVPIYTADFGRAKSEQDSRDGYYENYGLLSRVIIIQDNQFNQLSSPFPYYQKAINPTKDPKNIEKLNNKLWDFYNFK